MVTQGSQSLTLGFIATPFQGSVVAIQALNP